MRAGCWHWTCESPSRLSHARAARDPPFHIETNRNHRGMTPVQPENVGLKLLEAKLIQPDALQKAQQQIKSGGGSITQALVKLGAITEENLAKFLSDLYSVPSVDLSNFAPDPSVCKLIPGDVANKFQIVPLSRSGRRLTVAMANPSNIFAIDDIKFIT